MDSMLSSCCKHIRIKDNNDYDFDVDRYIQSIEKKYNIDFRSLPKWEELVKRLHVATSDCKRKIQEARLRESAIIDKLYVQLTRPSPWELNAGLCRTAQKWRNLENNLKKRKSSKASETKADTNELSMSMPDVATFTVHPNTEDSSSESLNVATDGTSKVHVVTQTMSSDESPRLPVVVVTNPHKYLSPLGSQDCGLSYKSVLSNTQVSASDKEEWEYLNLTTEVICTPTPIILTNNTLKKQFVEFSLTNCVGEYRHIRFKSIADESHFLRTKLVPVIPKRLYPGVPVTYKLIFQLKNQEEFKTTLYFKVGHDVYDGSPPEAFCVPIISAFTLARSVAVSETISIPPVYPWHIKRNDIHSSAIVRIGINDPYGYHLHIYKRIHDFCTASNSEQSVQASGPNTESVAERLTDSDMSTSIKTSSVKLPNEQLKGKIEKQNERLTMITNSIKTIVNDIVDLALETFLFDSTYLYMKPYSKAEIPVYFTKVEHIGFHQNYYDFEFIDPKTERVMIKKTIKVFAEVLPNPIQIHPFILDMSKSPVSFGYCEDHFVVSNTHKLYPVTVKIKLTTKMKRMFYVEPMVVVVPQSSCVPFAVKFCSRDFLSKSPSKDLVHFTFKIVVFGYKPVYENVPPFFYEVIAPCAVEFKRVYNEKYFKDG